MFTVKLIKVADVLTKFNLDLSDSSNFHSSWFCFLRSY
jgi:hypothetical protein